MANSISFRIASLSDGKAKTSEASSGAASFQSSGSNAKPLFAAIRCEKPAVQQLLSFSKSGEMEIEKEEEAPLSVKTIGGHRIIPCNTPLRATHESGKSNAPYGQAGATASVSNASSTSVAAVSSSATDSLSGTASENTASSVLHLSNGLNVMDKKRLKAPSDKTEAPILMRNTKLSDVRKSVFSKYSTEASGKGISEDDVSEMLLHKELETLPDMQFSSYQSVPIEEFGLAMLLGMGYDPKVHTNKPLELKKRIYQHAGLGADKALERELDMLDAKKSTVVQSKIHHNSTDGSGTASSMTASSVKTGEKLVGAVSNKQVDDRKPKVYTHWVTEGLYVKIASPKSSRFRHKGIVKHVSRQDDRFVCKVDISSVPQLSNRKDKIVYNSVAIRDAIEEVVSVDANDLETVISDRSKYAIIVRSKCTEKDKSLVTLGDVVRVERVDRTNDRVKIRVLARDGSSRYGGSHYVGLDDVCEYVDV